MTQSKASDALDGMGWREFEMLVGEGFRLQVYGVVETGGGGPVGGIDLRLSRSCKNGSEKFLVQSTTTAEREQQILQPKLTVEEADMARVAQRCIMAALDHSKTATITLEGDDGSQPVIRLPPQALASSA